MPSLAAIGAKQVQEIKSQNLATLMSTLDAVGAVSKVSAEPNGSGLPAGLPETIEARILSAPRDGRITLSIAGQMVEAELPQNMQRALANGALVLREGGTLSLKLDAATQSLRIATPALPASPATQVNITGHADPHAVSVGAPPPLANPFPAGSIGAMVAKLTGLSFPLAEGTGQAPSPGLEGEQATALRALLPNSATKTEMPAILRDALLKANVQDAPINQALSHLAAFAQQNGGVKITDLASALMALRLDASQPITPESIAKALVQSGVFHEANLAQGEGMKAAGDLKGLLLSARSQLRDMPNTDAMAKDVARAVDGAIERVKIQQIASIPDHPEMRINDDRAQPMRLSLSIPLAPHGSERPDTAAMGLMIEHRPPQGTQFEADPLTSNSDPETFPWKVRIAVDLEETGPVQAEIALRGQSIAVTLWAERHATAGIARREISALHQALSQASFDVTRLEVKDGRPTGSAKAVNPILDRRT